MASAAAGSPAAPVSRKIHLGLVIVFLALVAVQFYLAGRGIFGESSFDAHETLGGAVLHPISLFVLIAAIAGKSTRNRTEIGMSAGLFVLVTIQVAIGDRAHPAVAAFHPLLALVIVGLAFGILKRDREALAAT